VLGVANALPLDRARVALEGSDVTLLAYGPLVRTCLKSALAARQHQVEDALGQVVLRAGDEPLDAEPGIRTEFVARSKTGGFRSASAKDAASGPRAGLETIAGQAVGRDYRRLVSSKEDR
jgi:hypothetical protein